MRGIGYRLTRSGRQGRRERVEAGGGVRLNREQRVPNKELEATLDSAPQPLVRCTEVMPVTEVEIEKVVRESLDELYEKDIILIQNDVSERAITHKLAEYLQRRFPDLHVDCEYNRNVEFGEYAPKILHGFKKELLTRLKSSSNNVDEEALLAIST